MPVFGSALGAAAQPGGGKALEAMVGRTEADKTEKSLLIYGYQLTINTVIAAILLWRHGVVRTQRKTWRSSPFRLRYPLLAYLPWGDGLQWWHMVYTVAGLVVNWYSQLTLADLVERGAPTGIVTVLVWASAVWLQLAKLAKLWPRFRWFKLVEPVMAGVQLVGVSVMVGVVRRGGPVGIRVDHSVLEDPSLLRMWCTSILIAVLAWFSGEFAEYEEMRFPGRAFTLVDETARKMLASKILLISSVCRLAITFWFMERAVAKRGLPEITDPQGLLLAMQILLVGCVGNRVILLGFMEGNAGVKSIFSTAAMGCCFLWDWLLRGLAPTAEQGVGTLTTVIGATIVAWARWRFKPRQRE